MRFSRRAFLGGTIGALVMSLFGCNSKKKYNAIVEISPEFYDLFNYKGESPLEVGIILHEGSISNLNIIKIHHKNKIINEIVDDTRVDGFANSPYDKFYKYGDNTKKNILNGTNKEKIVDLYNFIKEYIK